MSEITGNQLAVNKLIILYFIDKIEIPTSRSHITQFLMEENYMSYFDAQQFLNELTELKYIKKNKTNNTTRYTITDEGSKILSYLIKIIPINIKKQINQYIQRNRNKIRDDFEVAANYFENAPDDYSIKCGLYEDDGTMLLELKLTVASKEHAKLICNNWKKNTSKIYSTIMRQLTAEKK